MIVAHHRRIVATMNDSADAWCFAAFLRESESLESK
jgi:hypothetical protein